MANLHRQYPVALGLLTASLLFAAFSTRPQTLRSGRITSIESSVGIQHRGTWSRVRNLGPDFNTASQEFGASVTRDGLTLLLYSDRPDGQGQSDIWMAIRPSRDSEFGELRNLAINTSSWEGGPKLSKDGLRLFFNSDRPGGRGLMDIYVASRTTIEDEFGDVTNLGPGVNSEYRDAGPVVGPDELTLYFQSERPGGAGGRDVWRAQRAQIQRPFGDPEPLSRAINSPHQEFAGSISSDGLALFFPSDRPQGLGVVDIYLSTRPDVESPFSPAALMEAPINSVFGDAGPSITPNWPSAGSKLYFASWTDATEPDQGREGYGQLDIFEATWSGP